MINRKEGVDDSWVLQYRYAGDPQWFLHGVTYNYDNGKPLSVILNSLRTAFHGGRINPNINTKDYAFQLVNTITGEVIPWEALGQ